MGIVIRQGVKGIVATYLGVIIGAFNMLWLFPKFLSSEEIGLTRVIVDIALLMAALSQFGAPNIADRFFSYFKNDEKKHNGFFVLLIIYPLLGFIFIMSLYLLLNNFWIASYQKRAPLLLDYFYHIIPLAFFIMYYNILEAYSRIHYRIVVPSMVKEVFLRIFLSVIVVIYHFKIITLDQLILLIIISYFCAVFLMLGYIKNLKKLYINPATSFENKPLLKEMLIFGLFIFLGGAWGLVASKIDVIMLSSMANLGSTGIYSISFFIGTIIEIPRRVISQISTPLVSQAWKNNDTKAIQDLYSKTSLNLLIAGLLLFLLVWCNIDSIFSIIPNSEEYKLGKYVVLMIALCRLTDMATGINTEIILNSSYYKFNFLLIFINAFIMIGGNYWLISLYGINGAAMSTLFSFILFNAVKSIFVYRKFKMQPFTINTVLILLFGIMAFIGAFFIPDFPMGSLTPFLTIAVKSIIILTIFLGLIFYFKISEDINNLIYSIFKKLKN
jgi:O-antigen/teichoic acid export membrane protein